MINHAAGSHGVSGIFVKYDTSSLMVTVSEQHMPLWQFLVRLCGIVGGIFSTTGEARLGWERVGFGLGRGTRSSLKLLDSSLCCRDAPQSGGILL